MRPPLCASLPLETPCIRALHNLLLVKLLDFVLVVDTSGGEQTKLSEPGSRIIFVWLPKF